jgi:hypothetical protein
MATAASEEDLKKCAALLRKVNLPVGEPRDVEQLLDRLVVAAETAAACREGGDFFDDEDEDIETAAANEGRPTSLNTQEFSIDRRRRKRKARGDAGSIVEKWRRLIGGDLGQVPAFRP